jgi:hypothetical protein
MGLRGPARCTQRATWDRGRKKGAGVYHAYSSHRILRLRTSEDEKRQIFVLGKSPFTEANFREDFAKSGNPPPLPRAISLVRLRRGQAICRLAQLARFLIRNGAGRGVRCERARISGRFAELTLRGCRLRLSPNRRSLRFGLMYAVRLYTCTTCSCTCGTVPDLTEGVHSDLLTDRSLGRHIFEDFRASCAPT